MRIPLPVGDVADRIVILRIKDARIADPTARRHVRRELDAVTAIWTEEGLPPLESLPEWEQLSAVNAALWDVEDELREREATGRFDAGFVVAARSVYRLNDRRAALKRAISARLGSEFIEQKAYRAVYREPVGTD